MGGIHFGSGHAHPEVVFVAPPRGPLQRVSADVKLLIALAAVVGTAVMPIRWYGWHVTLAVGLGVVVVTARIPVRRLLVRLLCLLPLIAGVVWTSAAHPGHGPTWPTIVVRSVLCLATMLVFNALVPFGAVPGVLARWRLPRLLVTTLTLAHRYFYVLGEEVLHMRKARASRGIRPMRFAGWRLPAAALGVLFIRASERAERVYLAMCSRGWK